jgi:hypothetical protein
MFAVHGLLSRGYNVVVMSKKRRSEMFGAQFLHERIPGLPQYHQTIRYRSRGTAEEYRLKVYGQSPVAFVSPERFSPKPRQVWDIRAAYYEAYAMYEDLIIDTADIGPAFLMQQNLGQYRFIVSTIPAPSLCYNPMHTFGSQQIWAIGDAPERGISCPVYVEEQTVICDGTREVGWYRVSNIFGYRTAEWPAGNKPPISHVAAVEKPITNNCNCYQSYARPIFREGRYGAWDKKILSHQAYHGAVTLAETI